MDHFIFSSELAFIHQNASHFILLSTITFRDPPHNERNRALRLLRPAMYAPIARNILIKSVFVIIMWKKYVCILHTVTLSKSTLRPPCSPKHLHVRLPTLITLLYNYVLLHNLVAEYN